MKKTIILVLLLGVAGLITFEVIRYVHPAPNQTVVPGPTATSTPSQKSIRVPINVFAGERSGYAMANPIENKALGTTFEFTEHPEISGEGRNGAWTVSELMFTPPLKEIKSGVFGAVAIALISFSPDNHYLAFRTRTVLGAGQYDFMLVVFNLQSGETITITAPEGLSSYKGTTFPYVESYEWNGSKLDIVMYTAEMVYILKPEAYEYYRIGPKQLWQYDLTSKTYAFIKNFNE